MTKFDRNYLNSLSDLGCIVCLLTGKGYTRPEIHHPRKGQGMAQRAPDSQAIPLCPSRHRNGGYGVALHAGQGEFERIYGTELELLGKTRQMLAQREMAISGEGRF